MHNNVVQFDQFKNHVNVPHRFYRYLESASTCDRDRRIKTRPSLTCEFID